MSAYEAAAVSGQRMFAAALAYRRLGWSILPVRDDKRPHFELLNQTYGNASWRRLRTHPATEEEIKEWYSREPGAGVGIITGGSTGLVVVDADEALPPGHRLVETPMVRSGRRRGLHIYLSSGAVDVAPRALPFGELKAEGGYVVAPPSRHACGKEYEWAIAPPGWGGVFIPEAPLIDLHDHPLIGALGLDEGSVSKEAYRLADDLRLQAKQTGDRLDDLRAWDRDERFVTPALVLLRIEAPLERKFRCVLPGHHEQRPSASLWKGDDGIVVYRDFHAAKYTGSGEELLQSFTLTEVFAVQISGRVRRLRGFEHRIWKLRLLAATGCLAPYPIPAKPGPADLGTFARGLYAGFVELLGLRWVSAPGTPAPYSWRFAAAWCGVPQHHVGEAMRELLGAAFW